MASKRAYLSYIIRKLLIDSKVNSKASLNNFSITHKSINKAITIISPRVVVVLNTCDLPLSTVTQITISTIILVETQVNPKITTIRESSRPSVNLWIYAKVQPVCRPILLSHCSEMGVHWREPVIRMTFLWERGVMANSNRMGMGIKLNLQL